MPNKVVTTRVPPDTHARLQALAEQTGRSLAATAADLLAAGVAGVPAVVEDGPLTAAVRATLAEITAPAAVMHRESALALARTVDRRERGHVAAVRELPDTVNRARSAQAAVDNPGPSTISEFLDLLDSAAL